MIVVTELLRSSALHFSGCEDSETAGGLAGNGNFPEEPDLLGFSVAEVQNQESEFRRGLDNCDHGCPSGEEATVNTLLVVLSADRGRCCFNISRIDVETVESSNPALLSRNS